MFTFDDFISGRVPEIGSREVISGEMANLKPMSHAEVSTMFPGIDLTDSEGIVYVPLTMCHSLPTVNARKRCFTSNTLANSFSSAVDSLVDREHMLQANGDLISENFADQIIGHIKSARFTGSKLSSGKEVAAEAMPLYALAALYMRATGVADMLKNHLNGNETWRTSMECGHSWKDAHLMYRGDFVPIADAPGGMLENIRSDTILPYQGYEVAAVLGGLDGFVDFWGLALTTQPADKGTELLGMVAGLSRDLASRKIFYAPIRGFVCDANEKALEVAGGPVDKKITELANISVIGESDESDGHKHLILSDLTILPANGHDHYIDSRNVSRGTKPALTGRTGVHYTSIRNTLGERIDEIPHLHLINVPLTGRFTSPQVSSGNNDGEIPASEVSNIGDLDEMKVQDILTRLTELSGQVASLHGGGQDEKFKEFASGLTVLAGELKEVASQDAIKAAVEEEINKRIKAGQLLTKEKADEAVTTAVEEKTKEHDEQQVVTVKRSERLVKVKDAGINPEFEFEGINDADGKPMTIQKVLDGLDIDDAGDQQFALQFSSWKQIADSAKKEVDAKIANSQQVQEAQDVETKKLAAAAASKKDAGNKGILATVGGSTSSEAASVPDDVKNAPRHMMGKHAVTSAK